MVTAVQVAGITITAVLLVKTLQQYSTEQAMLLTLLVCIGLMSVAVLALTPLLARIDALLNAGGITAEETAALSKGIGICIITELAADTCRDAGESALATAARKNCSAEEICSLTPWEFQSLLEFRAAS